MIRIVVVQAASFERATFAVLALLDKVERSRVNPLDEISKQERVSLEPGRIPHEVRSRLACSRICPPLDSQEFRINLLFGCEVSEKSPFDVQCRRRIPALCLSEVVFDHFP